MLFSLFIAANAAASQVVTTFPCQRLGWAWRNVWVTCAIDARVPGNYDMPTQSVQTANLAPNLNEGFHSWGKSDFHAPTLDVDAVGTVPADYATKVGAVATVTGLVIQSPTLFSVDSAVYKNTFKMPNLCVKFGAPGAPAGTLIGVRTACRRAVDLYGSLLELCRNPTRARIPLAADGVAPSGSAGNPIFFGTNRDWTKATPAATMSPHAGNVFILNFLQQQCVTPQQLPLGPANSCPGLTGWWSVTFQACNFANEFATNNILTPQKMANVQAKLVGNWENLATTNAAELCTSGTATVDGTNWVPRGPTFHRSACRRAIDQFTRAAHRCNANVANQVPAQAALTKLAIKLGSDAPLDCA